MLHHGSARLSIFPRFASLHEELEVQFKCRGGERKVVVLEDGRVHDTEAADLLGLLAGKLQEDSSGVTGEVGGVCNIKS